MRQDGSWAVAMAKARLGEAIDARTGVDRRRCLGLAAGGPGAALLLSACGWEGTSPVPRKTPAAAQIPASSPTPAPAPQLSLPTEDTVLATLRPGHPRLILLPEVLERVQQSVAADAVARGYRDALVASGERLLTEAPPQRVLVGPRLLDVSRRVLERVYTLGLLYRLDGDERWLTRVVQEMVAAAGFTDWNPSHFLDVAEMSHALAIGYDWLYDALSDGERQTIKGALVEKGLRAAEQAYRNKAWWWEDRFNWNNVCNGGVATGALAVAEDEPALSRFLLVRALSGLPKALASYGPDGAWAEGPGYWGYATKYTVLALAALESALGTDFGLSTMPGLPETGAFRLHSAGPTRLFFNFADAGEGSGDEPSLFWLARRFNQPLLAWGGRDAAGVRGSARDLLWYDPRGSRDDLARVGLDARYAKDHLAFFRSAWSDPRAIYVGFKGGDNKANHSHLDLGTFVLDALGQRWALDLGPDDYNLPGYFQDPQSPASTRWTYYRLRTAGHNTLVVDGENQNPKAAAPLAAFHSAADAGFAVATLTAAYAHVGVSQAQRGIALLQRRSVVLVQDELEASKPVEVVWSMHTKAEVTVDPASRRAVLSLGGQHLEALLLSPADARFAVHPVMIPPPQRPAPGVKRLVVDLPGKAATVRLSVLLAPLTGLVPATPVKPATSSSRRGAVPKVVPLDQWASALR